MAKAAGILKSWPTASCAIWLLRAIVGTLLVEVGRGRPSLPEEMNDIIERRDRSAAGHLHAREALFLWDIQYPYIRFVTVYPPSQKRHPIAYLPLCRMGFYTSLNVKLLFFGSILVYRSRARDCQFLVGFLFRRAG